MQLTVYFYLGLTKMNIIVMMVEECMVFKMRCELDTQSPPTVCIALLKTFTGLICSRVRGDALLF